MMDQNQRKQQVAEMALEHLSASQVLGVGTGSTVNFFIEALKQIKAKVEVCVASSKASAQLLTAAGFEVVSLNSAPPIDIYVDGADEVNPHKQMIKGGGAALTGEKILATAAKKFICLVDNSKCVEVLGKFPLPVEVIPMARSFVARQIVQMGGHPVYREGCVTDYGNQIIDVHHFDIIDPLKMETRLNQIPGVVCNGIFAHRPADLVLVGE